MRIALLHYSVPPVIGGVESTIAAHARLFAARHDTVKIIAGRGAPFDAPCAFHRVPEMDSRHPRVEIVQRELNAGNVSDAFHALTQELTDALARLLQDCDVCLAHNIATLHKNLALSAALHHLAETRRVRLLAWSHDFAWDDPVYAKELHDGAPWDLLRTAWKHTQYVVVSEARRQELARLLGLQPNAIVVAPPGVNVMEFLGVTDRVAQWVAQFHWLDAAPLLLLPARVTRRKNIERALEIVAALRDAGMQPQLLVMGPLGPHNPKNRAYLEELKTRAGALNISNAVHWLQEYGVVDDAMRRDLYALADALLLPSAREGFGIPILEAGLARLPIFCAAIPPFRETAGENAHYLKDDAVPAQIASEMRQYFLQDERYRLKQRVLQHHTWEKIFASRIVPLLQGMSALTDN
ncbi:MAG: glycosyltransferase family 4 protein [Chloroflexi bacterium]|nr:glycosyltransferase family 4 protein [Chloroflexota bacterium]